MGRWRGGEGTMQKTLTPRYLINRRLSGCSILQANSYTSIEDRVETEGDEVKISFEVFTTLVALVQVCTCTIHSADHMFMCHQTAGLK